MARAHIKIRGSRRNTAVPQGLAPPIVQENGPASYRFPGVPGCKAYYQIEGENMWVTLTHGSPQTIPPIAHRRKDCISIDYLDENDELGTRLAIEPGFSAGWYHPPLHYYTWAPAYKPGKWYDISASGSLAGALEVTESGVWRIRTTYMAQVASECREAIDWVKVWWDRMKKQDSRLRVQVPLPDFINIDALQWTYVTEKELRKKFIIIQRQFVGALGALRWLLLMDKKWKHSLQEITESVHMDLFVRFMDWGLLKHNTKYHHRSIAAQDHNYEGKEGKC